MKTTFIVIFVLSISLIHSQTNKSDIMINLNGKSILSTFYEDGFNLNICPRFGCFIINDLILGIGSEIQYDKDQLTYIGSALKYNTCSYTLGPFLRYYLPHKKHALFWHIDTYFGNSRTNSITQNSLYITSSVTQSQIFDCGLGYTYFINRYIGIETLLKFQNWRSRGKIGLVNEYDKKIDEEFSDFDSINSLLVEINIHVSISLIKENH